MYSLNWSLLSPGFARMGHLIRSMIVVVKLATLLGGASVLKAGTPLIANQAIFSAGSLTLQVGQSIRSNNGQYRLILQMDGNLVLYRINRPLFQTNTVGRGATRLIFQADGNLVLYNAQGGALWNTRTNGNPGSRFIIQDDGNLVIYSVRGVALWNSVTAFPGAKPFVDRIVTGRLAKTNTKIVQTIFPTVDVVVADYDAVADFFADPTGQWDSRQAIQNALDQCYWNGGGTVWLPPGTYRLDSAIRIHAFCTLRGDWRDPDDPSLAASGYGTVILAKLPSGEWQPPLITVGGSAALMGVTIYYPDQSIPNVIPYNYSILIPGKGLGEDYMVSSVVDVTLLNSYKGVGVSPNAIHENATIRNLKGTVLRAGLFSTNSADVDVYENIVFDSKYWFEAGSQFNAPAKNQLDQYSIQNVEGFTIGNLEWAQFSRITASNCAVGIHFIRGSTRSDVRFSGSFVEANLTQCKLPVLADSGSLDKRWNACFVGGTFQATGLLSVQNDCLEGDFGYLQLYNTDLVGATWGRVRVNSGPAAPAYPAFSPVEVPRTSRPFLYDTSLPPYSVRRVQPNSDGVIPTSDIDATSQIQQALNDASVSGGGVVYLPAGWYYVGGHLTVPANVELRGSSSCLNRDQGGLSLGTVLFAYEGANVSNIYQATAFITMGGERSGISGLRIFYPGNNPLRNLFNTGWQFAPTYYPCTIRGNGSYTYVRNICVANGTYATDFSSYRNDHHYFEGLVGSAMYQFVRVGNGQGVVRDARSNGTAVCRVGFGIHDWLPEVGDRLFVNYIDSITKGNLNFAVIEGGNGIGGEVLCNIFAFGARHGVYNNLPGTLVFNLGTDQLGSGGYSIVATQPITVLNVLRSRGSGSFYGYPPSGAITCYNESYIHE